jgi:hypothetical protein
LRAVPHHASGPADALPTLQDAGISLLIPRAWPRLHARLGSRGSSSAALLDTRNRREIESGSVNVAQIRRCVANRTLARLYCSLCVLYTNAKSSALPDELRRASGVSQQGPSATAQRCAPREREGQRVRSEVSPNVCGSERHRPGLPEDPAHRSEPLDRQGPCKSQSLTRRDGS